METAIAPSIIRISNHQLALLSRHNTPLTNSLTKTLNKREKLHVHQVVGSGQLSKEGIKPSTLINWYIPPFKTPRARPLSEGLTVSQNHGSSAKPVPDRASTWLPCRRISSRVVFNHSRMLRRRVLGVLPSQRQRET